MNMVALFFIVLLLLGYISRWRCFFYVCIIWLLRGGGGLEGWYIFLGAWLGWMDEQFAMGWCLEKARGGGMAWDL